MLINPIICKMEPISFYKRFKNRSQFISKEGNIQLGSHSVMKKAVSTTKIHSDYEALRIFDTSPIFTIVKHNSISDPYQQINKSFSMIKLPSLSKTNSKKKIVLRDQTEVNKINPHQLGYSMKLKKKQLSNQNLNSSLYIKRQGSLII